MESIFQAFIALLVCFFIVYITDFIKRKLLLSLRKDGDVRLAVTVAAKGVGKGLSETLKEAERLRRESRLSSNIVIVDAGMAEEARREAEDFVRKNGFAEISRGTGEDIWKTPSTQE